jgi:glyoxylase-like metal-dependent hydrolase (beta-lactamase superfamily II)
MKIVDGVHSVDGMPMSHAFLIEDNGQLTLIDAGSRGGGAKVLQTIESLGFTPEALKQIVVTHYHHDHVSGLAELTDQTSAHVLVHAVDAPAVRGEETPPSGGFLRPIFGRIAHYGASFRVDGELRDGDIIEPAGLQVIHTPGHTAGHIALYLRSARVLFTGDAIFNIFGGLRRPPYIFNRDGAQAKESIRKFDALECDAICFAHGPPLTEDATTHLRAFINRLG